jgi:hypothetical protein
MSKKIFLAILLACFVQFLNIAQAADGDPALMGKTNIGDFIVQGNTTATSFTADPSATPSIGFTSSNDEDGDTGAQIYMNETTVTAGAQVSDMVFQAMGAAGTAGSLETFMTWDGSAQSLILPLSNDAVTPTLAFGDGDSGFYESSDDTLYISGGGTALWRLSSPAIDSLVAFGGSLRHAAATATTPVLTFSNDEDTGIGRAAADQLSLIAGEKEIVRYTENTYVETQQMPPGGSAHGGYVERVFAATSGALTGATDTIELNIPSNWQVKACQLHVKTAVVDDGGDDTWSATLDSSGTDESIDTGIAAAQNTNHNHFSALTTDAETDITLTPNGGSFTSGEIEAHCLCFGFADWSNE